MIFKCDKCGCKDTYIKNHLHEYANGVKFYSSRRFCSSCHQFIYDEELDNEASIKALRERNKILGVDPDAIVTLRKEYNLTQEQFAKIIGCAKKTLISYEQGKSIPNDIYLVTLKMLLDNPEIIKNMIETNLDRYSKDEYNKLVLKLEKIYNIDEEEIKQEPTDYNGYCNYSFEKIKNLILKLSENGILKTKLLKEMFYCDFLTYKNTATSITGLEYIKYQYGPVPCNYESILNKLVEMNLISMDIKYENDFEYIFIKSNNKFNDMIFYNEEIEIINKVIKFFKNYNVSSIVDYSHKEKAFVENKLFDKISYDFAMDMRDL